jgi:hypothetical protein
MLRSLHHNLVRANRVHAVEHAHGLPVFLSLNKKEGRAIMKYPGTPCAVGFSEFLDRPWGEMLISWTERADGYRIVEIRHHLPPSTHHPTVRHRV